jgi:hypothetical protein
VSLSVFVRRFTQLVSGGQQKDSFDGVQISIGHWFDSGSQILLLWFFKAHEEPET